ncbi:CPBP family intramembrane metalloprotease [Salipiger sp. P9]|uniref:CPBP family intramembrane glutamic endopeptidase n=1 Tax=Salipiger pentaromativorans TaxID=2943193 RepID=UPI0021582DCF|nr:type II CAAX endopeptidase family protein [Salipiger pentaromativorans]MCR8549055.1 CPBP family intramembrane metalloprotease [Salipiger pentaromativorans]
MSYRAFDLMTRPARGAELWRLALGLILAMLVTYGLGQGVIAMAALVLPRESYWALIAQMERGETPVGLLALLFNAGTMGIGALVAAQTLHRRAPASLFGPLPLALRQFLRVAAAVAVLYIVIAALPPWTQAETLVPGLAPERWLTLLPLTLTALLIQTGSEELLFRGYLQSQLAARLHHPAVWLIAPSALFALGHWAPGVYGGNAGLVVLWAFAFGLSAADLTARAGTLGPAIALHLLNNLAAIAIVSPQGLMSGLALFLLPFDPADEAAVRALLPLDLISVFLSWLTARIVLRV